MGCSHGWSAAEPVENNCAGPARERGHPLLILRFRRGKFPSPLRGENRRRGIDPHPRVALRPWLHGLRFIRGYSPSPLRGQANPKSKNQNKIRRKKTQTPKKTLSDFVRVFEFRYSSLSPSPSIAASPSPAPSPPAWR